MQETQDRSLVQEDPTCLRATKPMSHNYGVHAPEPGSLHSWANVWQLLKSESPRTHAAQEEPLQRDWRGAPALHSRESQPEKSPCSDEDPARPQRDKQMIFKNKAKKKKKNSKVEKLKRIWISPHVQLWLGKQVSITYFDFNFPANKSFQGERLRLVLLKCERINWLQTGYAGIN